MADMDRPRIVVLDGATLNPGDNPFPGLDELGTVEIHPASRGEEIPQRLAGAAIAVTNKAPISRTTMAACPELKFIAVTATGYNIVDTDAAKERGIPVSNVPVYSTASVAQFTFALLLELCHRVGLHNRLVHEGEWIRSPDFSFWRTPQVELEGLRLVLVGGNGRIGQMVANLGRAFGMEVVALGRRDDIAAAAATADVLSLHCPLTADNTGMIDAALLSRMKPSAFLINTARGALVNEADLAEALRNGTIAGAAVDVVGAEPMAADCPLRNVPNCLITPHIAWTTLAARRRLAQTTVDNVRAFLAGKPINQVA